MNEKIKDARLRAGLTMKEVDQAVGIKGNWVSRIESGVIDVENITLKKAIKLADILGFEDLRDMVKK